MRQCVHSLMHAPSHHSPHLFWGSGLGTEASVNCSTNENYLPLFTSRSAYQRKKSKANAKKSNPAKSKTVSIKKKEIQSRCQKNATQQSQRRSAYKRKNFKANAKKVQPSKVKDVSQAKCSRSSSTSSSSKKGSDLYDPDTHLRVHPHGAIGNGRHVGCVLWVLCCAINATKHCHNNRERRRISHKCNKFLIYV